VRRIPPKKLQPSKCPRPLSGEEEGVVDTAVEVFGVVGLGEVVGDKVLLPPAVVSVVGAGVVSGAEVVSVVIGVIVVVLGVLMGLVVTVEVLSVLVVVLLSGLSVETGK